MKFSSLVVLCLSLGAAAPTTGAAADSKRVGNLRKLITSHVDPQDHQHPHPHDQHPDPSIHPPRDPLEDDNGDEIIPQQHPEGGHHPHPQNDDNSFGYDVEVPTGIQELNDEIDAVEHQLGFFEEVLNDIDDQSEVIENEIEMVHQDVQAVIDEIHDAEARLEMLREENPEADLTDEEDALAVLHEKLAIVLEEVGDDVVHAITPSSSSSDDVVSPASGTKIIPASDGECGDGVLHPMLGEQCDYGGTEAGVDATKAHLINGGDFSPCNDDCTWKNNNDGCEDHEVYFDMYLVTDHVAENWAELKMDGVAVWNPQIDGDVMPVYADGHLMNYAKPDEAYQYSTCMDPTKCWSFWFLDETSFDSEGEYAVFDIANAEFAKLVVLLDGRLEYSDESYLTADGFSWGNCSDENAE